MTLEEIKALFAAENYEKAWAGHPVYRAINVVAAGTGMRLGELLAVRGQDLHGDHIHVKHSYNPKFGGLLPTKTRASC